MTSNMIKMVGTASSSGCVGKSIKNGGVVSYQCYYHQRQQQHHYNNREIERIKKKFYTSMNLCFGMRSKRGDDRAAISGFYVHCRYRVRGHNKNNRDTNQKVLLGFECASWPMKYDCMNISDSNCFRSSKRECVRKSSTISRGSVRCFSNDSRQDQSSRDEASKKYFEYKKKYVGSSPYEVRTQKLRMTK